MRKLLPMLAAVACAAGFTLGVRADDAEKTITGMAQCAKCALKETKDCQNVVVVKEGDSTVNYYLEMNDVAKQAHAKLGFCSAPKGEGPQVKVTGAVADKDGKKVLTASKIEKGEEPKDK